MKKKILFIISLLLPSVVLADMGAPSLKEYDVEVSDSEGAYCYEYKKEGTKESMSKVGVVPNGTKIHISYELSFNNENFGYIYYNNTSCYINLSSTINLTSDISLSDYENNKVSEDYTKGYTLDTLSVYSSPATGFTKVGTIDKYKEVNVLYYYSSDSSWYYIEYNDIKGWVNIIEGALGFKRNKTIKLFEDATVFYTTDTYSGLGLGTISKNTEINSYYELDAWSRGIVYINYDTYHGYIESAFGISSNKKLHTLNSIKAYSNYSDISNNMNSIDIPKDIELQVKYIDSVYDGVYYLIEYNNKEYYIYNSYHEDTSVEEIINSKGTIKDSVNIYDSIYSNNIIGTLNKDDIVNVIYYRDNYYYIEYNDIKGWIPSYKYNDGISNKTIDIEEVEEDNTINNDNNIEKDYLEIESNDNIDIDIYTYIGIASCIAIVILGIILFINKKKKE